MFKASAVAVATVVLFSGCTVVDSGKEMVESVFNSAPTTVNGAKNEILTIMNQSVKLTVDNWKYDMGLHAVPSACSKPSQGGSGVKFYYILRTSASTNETSGYASVNELLVKKGFSAKVANYGNGLFLVEGAHKVDSNLSLMFRVEANGVTVEGYSRCVDGDPTEHIRDSNNM